MHGDYMSFPEEVADKSHCMTENRPIHQFGIDQDPVEIPYDYSLHDKLKTIAGISGNVLEWYDFAVFGFFGDIRKYSTNKQCRI